MKTNRTEFEMIAKALSICMPETKEEGEQVCDECPFCEICANESISFPSPLAIAIRSYFSKNRLHTKIIQ